MLYLHIGMSKTGSTTIQHFLTTTPLNDFGLHAISSFGQGNSWKLPAASGTPTAQRYWVRNRGILTEAEFDNLKTEVWDHLHQELADHTENSGFIISSEYIYRQYFGQYKALIKLRKKLLKHFDDLRIILYLRDQRSYMRSLYAQQVVGPTQSSKSFEEFFYSYKNAESGWNYQRGVRLWSKVFGAERLRLVPFDHRNFHQGDLIRNFLGHMSSEAAERFTTSASKNISPGYRQIQASRMANGLPELARRPASYLLTGLSRYDAIGNLIGPKDFPSDFDDEILDLVSEGNDWINTNFLQEYAVKLPVKAVPAQPAAQQTA